MIQCTSNNIRKTVLISALNKGPERARTNGDIASLVTREMQLLNYILYLFHYFLKEQCSRPMSEYRASHIGHLVII